MTSVFLVCMFNTLRSRQNGRHFADDIFKRIFFNENVWISIKISLKFVPKGPINNIPALVQIMAWRRPGDKPLSEPMTVSLPTHICVTRPQWVNTIRNDVSQWAVLWRESMVCNGLSQWEKTFHVWRLLSLAETVLTSVESINRDWANVSPDMMSIK